MYFDSSLSAAFESEKNKKAFTYTALICAMMLMMAIFISWKLPAPPEPIVQDLIEVNLGNEVEGSGTVQPLIKGEKAPDRQEPAPPVQSVAKVEPVKDITPEENEKDEEAAPVPKPVKAPTPKVVQPTVVAVPVPKPQKPKIAGYNGPATGTGNGATVDNGYRYQGNGTGKGDAGNPNGKPDSYGNHPGGKSGGSLRVTKGDRTIVNNYIFMGDLPKATINAVIKVTPDGRGTFISFDRGSTSNESSYASAIRSYLPNIQFNKADHESVVTVPFNFRVN